MRKFLTLSAQAVGGLLLCTCVSMASAPAHAIDDEGITIIADASLIQPLRIITERYTRRERVGITLISDPRHYPIDRISEGLSADMVITANSEAQADLENMGLADRFATKPLASEPMVLLRNPAADDASNNAGARGMARATTPTLVVLDNPNFPSITAMSEEIGAHVFTSTPTIVVVTNRDEWYRTLKEPNHFTLVPKTLRSDFPALSLVREITEPDNLLHVQGDVLAGTRMSDSRALLAFLAGPDAAAVWREFGYKPENY